MNIFRQLKKLRLLNLVSNVKHFRTLKKNAALYKELGIKKKFWQSLAYTDIPQNTRQKPWLDAGATPDTIRSHPQFSSFSTDAQQGILQWAENGYLFLPGFFSTKAIDAARESIWPGLTKKEQQDYTTNRLLNLHHKNPQLAALINDPALLRLLSFVLGRNVSIFQSINFHRSSSQRAHSDSMHLTTEPLGHLICVWIALEDVRPGSGEFFYFPGSHRLPFIDNHQFEHHNSFWKIDQDLEEKYEAKVASVIEEQGLIARHFLPKRGTIMIWHGNLLHGSMPRQRPNASRQSLIGHYFAEGALYYHESMETPAVMRTR